MRLIISDLDGTILLRGENRINRVNLKAIEDIIGTDAVFCVASGRNYGELKRIFDSFQDKIYFIANDGALAVHKDEIIFDFPIPEKKIKQFKECKNFVAHGRYISFVRSKSERFVRIIKEQYFGHILEIEGIDEINEPIYKITVYGEKNTKTDLDIVNSDNYICEYVEKGTNKGMALCELAKNLELKKSDIIAIGDDFNDIEMLKLAGKSYAVAAAPPKVKKISGFVVNEFKDFAEVLIKE